jgi:FkbM family methyltransferase
MTKPFLKKVSGRGFAGLSWTLRKLGYRVERFDELNFLEPLLYRRLARSPDFFFVQIGANDGVFCDPIRPFVTRNGVAGLVVEPLPDVFEKLVVNYRDYPRVKPVKRAIHRTEKQLKLYRVDPARAAGVGDWALGTMSFDANHPNFSRVPPGLIVTENVACSTLGELLAENGVKQLDFLQIDTEGYDFEIIKMIDFDRNKPAIIHFEHGMPDGIMTPEAFKACTALLMDQGYYVMTEPFDAIAYQPGMI